MNDRIARCQKMVDQAPDNELARFSLGKALFDDNQYEAAFAQFQVAVASKPDWMLVWILIGRCHLMLGKRDEARQALQRAHELALIQNHQGPQREVEDLLRELES